MRRLLLTLALAALGALLMPFGTATAAPATGELRSNLLTQPPFPEQPRRTCLDVPNYDSGTRIDLLVCDSSQGQRFLADGNVTGTIVLRDALKCVDVGGGATHPGAPVQIWSCNGTAAQQWQFIPVVTTPEATFYSVRNPVSGLCLRYAFNGGSIIADCTPILNPQIAGQTNLFTLAAQLF
jgi:hypothetical protein